MIKIKYSITIDASKEKVWHTMLDQETYKLWTEAFSPGSHYVGNWDKGSKIHFLGPDKDGNLGGMVSRIKENRPYEYISIEHLGFVLHGKEDTESEAAKSMAGALENYTLIENDGKTEVLVDMDSTEEYEEMFNDMWPKALNKLKELAEE